MRFLSRSCVDATRGCLMRLIVHDYSGHPFQLQLSRALAARGHNVIHQYCVSYNTGRGAVRVESDDPESFAIEPLSTRGVFARYSVWRRIVQEIEYGASLGHNWRRHRPDVVLLCNIPLLANWIAVLIASQSGLKMVFWHQDVYSDAIGTSACNKLGPRVGALVAWVANQMERSVARNSARVVVITDEFLSVHDAWGLPRSAISVIHNWGAIDEITPQRRQNRWATERSLGEVPVFMYTGTLGIKHNPQTLVELALHLGRVVPEARLVVVSEGQGRAWLQLRRAELGLTNLDLLDYQPYHDLPDVLGSADVLIAILEPEASRYSVPSKVLNYLCAGRPVLAVMPVGNAAARVIAAADAGLVVEESGQMLRAVDRLLRDDVARQRMGASARQYAETNFDISAVARKFEEIIVGAGRSSRPR